MIGLAISLMVGIVVLLIFIVMGIREINNNIVSMGLDFMELLKKIKNNKVF